MRFVLSLICSLHLGSKMRPLGIPVLEDKIVQQAVRMIGEKMIDTAGKDGKIRS